jgi:miniconductance mechanosensitive channel
MRGFLDSVLQSDDAMLVAVLLGVVAVAALLDLIVSRLLQRLVKAVVARTPTRWDDVLVERNLFGRLAHLAPALVIWWLAPLVIRVPWLLEATTRVLGVYMVVVGVLVVNALLAATGQIYATYEASRRVPIKGFLQVGAVVSYCVAGIVVLAILLGLTPVYLLSGLGAITAVLLIVFKDPLLGLVAGIQLSANRMVAIGDWVEMPSNDADGEVIDVALTTVKVRNWDMSITTVPSYDLISKSFRNWRSMQESGGRRIKRAVYIDTTSIRFCDEALLEGLGKIKLLEGYLSEKRAEIAAHNQEQGVGDDCPVNGRRLTNVGTFRAYLFAYLRSLPRIHKDRPILVRQLQPGEHGLPIEIYLFTDTTEWSAYEAIQGDIFDHVLAVVPDFGLRLFQLPTTRP